MGKRGKNRSKRGQCADSKRGNGFSDDLGAAKYFHAGRRRSREEMQTPQLYRPFDTEGNPDQALINVLEIKEQEKIRSNDFHLKIFFQEVVGDTVQSMIDSNDEVLQYNQIQRELVKMCCQMAEKAQRFDNIENIHRLEELKIEIGRLSCRHLIQCAMSHVKDKIRNYFTTIMSPGLKKESTECLRDALVNCLYDLAVDVAEGKITAQMTGDFFRRITPYFDRSSGDVSFNNASGLDIVSV